MIAIADIYSPDKRSEIMSKIRGKDTGIERAVSSYLHRKGFLFRKNVNDIPGTPNIAIKKYKVAIFVNGCFRHGHKGCNLNSMPKSNSTFWNDKIQTRIEIREIFKF